MHQEFIKKTILGALNQKTSFLFEILIVDDASSDKTNEVIEDVIKNNQELTPIRYLHNEVNKGMNKNFIYALEGCKSKYIAICEGDDYWTDPLKLQKQVDFLEAHPEYELCFTNVQVVDEKGTIVKEKLSTNPNRKDDFVLDDLPIWAPTLTRVFRNRNFSSLSKHTPSLDSYMLLWQAKYGKIKYLNDITGAYRIHKGGIYSALDEVQRYENSLITTIDCMQLVPSHLYLKYFGIQLKLLLKIKGLNSELFNDNYNRFLNAYGDYGAKMSSISKTRINAIVTLLKLPIFGTKKRYKWFMNKLINHLIMFKFTA